MAYSKNNIVIKVTAKDNVGVVANLSGLPKGAEINEGIKLIQDVPMGHKVALTTIGEGGEIIRYGQTIGYANKPTKRMSSGWKPLYSLSEALAEQIAPNLCKAKIR